MCVSVFMATFMAFDKCVEKDAAWLDTLARENFGGSSPLSLTGQIQSAATGIH